MPWGRIIIGSFLVCTFFMVASLVGTRKKAIDWPMYLGSLLVTFLFNTLLIWFFTPPINGPFFGMVWLFWSLLLGTAVAVGYGTVTEGKDRWGSVQVPGNWAPTVAGLLVVVIASISLLYMTSQVPMGLIIGKIPIVTNEVAAKNLAALGNVREVEYTVYPETDTDHLNLLPSEVALDKVVQNWSRGGKDFPTLYRPGDLVIQEVQGTLQYVAETLHNNRWGYEQTNGGAPSLVIINAEDPNAEPKILTGYEIRYFTKVPSGLLLTMELIPPDKEVRRYLYFSGFAEYDLVDPTLELDDNLRPFITVALMKPTYNFGAYRLEGFVTVDAQSGEIRRYDPGKVAEEAPWIDRVYPDDLIEQYVDWWCQWGNAPHFNPSGAKTCGIANRPLPVVYTDAQHPAWQVFLESRNPKSAGSSTGVVLCSTKHPSCQFYEFLGLPVGSPLDDKFEGESSRQVTGGGQFDVRNLELHRIHGQPTFIGQYIKPEGEIDKASEGTLAGIVIAPAREFQTADISYGRSREEALGAYYRYLAAGGRSPKAPAEESVGRVVEGKIHQITPQIRGGNTEYWIYLQGVTNRIFVAEASGERGFHLVPLSQPGDGVTLTFDDTGEMVVYLSQFKNPEAQRRLESTPAP